MNPSVQVWLLGWPKRRLKGPLVRLMHLVLIQPRLNRLARGILPHFPRLQTRLQGLMHQAALVPAPRAKLAEPPSQAPGDLSPRTLRTYRELKKAQKAMRN